MLDVAAIRRDFPILARQVRGRRLVYLDNAATTQKPRQVIEALVRVYEQHNANPHRGVHTLATETTDLYEAARAHVARFINARRAEEVVFTENATAAINLVAHSWGRATLKPRDEVVLTHMEHHANLVPWQITAAETGAVLRFIPLLPDGTLDMDAARRLIGPATRIVAVTAMSNVLGTINDLRPLIDLAHEFGAVVLVDGAQSVPHIATDVQALHCDFLAFSAHKMLGPTGVGVLYGRYELLDRMGPFLAGGSMILKVEWERSRYNEVPWRFEAGTPNYADAIAFDAALDYLEALGMDAVREHEVQLTAYALGRLAEVDGMRIFGPPDATRRGGVISFYYGDIHPHDVGTVLDYAGVAVRAGHHCAQPLMQLLDVPATVRASFYVYNGRDDVDALTDALTETAKVFGYAARTRAG